MTSSRLHGRARRTRPLVALGAAAVLTVSVAGCGSSDSGSGSSGSGSGSAESSAAVKKLDQPLDSYSLPTEPVGDISAFKGKTIYYIPVTLQSPQFAATQKVITNAAEAAGLKVQVCDGKGTPTDINGCVSQAVSANAAAIVTDAIAYGLASGSLDAAQKAKVPVVINSQVADKDHPASSTLAYVGENAGSDQQKALAEWTIADSGGKADVLINQVTDGPSPAAFVKAGKKVFSAKCPDCKVSVNGVSSANFSLVPSSTSAALLKDPNVKYVQSQFEQFLQPTTAGISAASKTGLKVIAGAAELSSLKALKSGQIQAAAGQAASYQAWADIDAVLRMLTGKQAPDYDIPVRLFTQSSVSKLDVSEKALESGAWFGPTSYTDDFKKLWGVA